uniref:Secreted protein n=1 Tax=Globodera rostochiensis TaxID=31243 RepID=A0A914H9W5_GLORO
MYSHSVIILSLMLAFFRYCIGSGMPYNEGFRITESTEYRPHILESSKQQPPPQSSKQGPYVLESSLQQPPAAKARKDPSRTKGHPWYNRPQADDAAEALKKALQKNKKGSSSKKK